MDTYNIAMNQDLLNSISSSSSSTSPTTGLVIQPSINNNISSSPTPTTSGGLTSNTPTEPITIKDTFLASPLLLGGAGLILFLLVK